MFFTSLHQVKKTKGGYSHILSFLTSKFTGKKPISIANTQQKPKDQRITGSTNNKVAASMILEHGKPQAPLKVVPVNPVGHSSLIVSISVPTGSKKTKSSCEFALVIPSYNNEKYYEENLNSACWQNSTNPYHIYYINDCSTDATGKRVEEYVRRNGLEDRFTLINNPVNLGGGANIYNTIHKYLADHKIVVILDGDDLFPHNNVLLTLEDYYKDPDLWMTYGVLQKFGANDQLMGEEIPEDIIKNNRIRQESAVTALRTFKAGVFYKKIKKNTFIIKVNL